MATNWGKVKYIARVRPDSDDGIIDECNDSLDECDVRVKINDVSGETDQDNGFKSRSRRFQPYLKRIQYDSLCLSVPQDIGRGNDIPYEQVKSGQADKTALRKRSHSANSLSVLYGAEINGDIPLRSQSLLKIVNRRVLVKDLFAKEEEVDRNNMKVRKSNLYRSKYRAWKTLFLSFKFMQISPSPAIVKYSCIQFGGNIA